MLPISGTAGDMWCLKGGHEMLFKGLLREKGALSVWLGEGLCKAGTGRC